MYLAASIAALLIGPLLYQLARGGGRVLGFFEGFAFITIAGLLMFRILPQAVAGGGAPAWVFVAAGLVFPVVLERLLHRLAHEAHAAILLLGMVGLAVHAAIDGVALALPGLLPAGAEHATHAGAGDDELALAVALHRFPVGLAVWYLLVPSFGVRVAAAVLGAMAIATLAGFAAGDLAATAMQSTAFAGFQAFVGGSILHVIVYEPGHHEMRAASGSMQLDKWPDRMGLICGLALLFLHF